MSTTFSYVAHLDEEAAKRAARAFYIRSVLKLRPWRTVLPPVFFGLATLFMYRTGGDSWPLGVFITFFFFSLIFPIGFLVARPIAAARFARKNPEQFVGIGANGLTLKNQNGEATIGWKRFKYVWDVGDYVILVISPFASLNLPKQGMPEGAQQFILQSVVSANAN
ncbi:MAG: YcxB family protein [Rudaea sp.]|uniref:YcxB family protein n=1 Tax=unclassified Rudaea TaxID=2627037 RepID=UPI0010FA2C95|nr:MULTISPECIES: YcxB family protein [unclassified Rudaea]MBN8884945.1 YcxB family protein [Rudaea sp.]MBR0344478.1 YcxB family protein [Rudaea sp.]